MHVLTFKTDFTRNSCAPRPQISSVSDRDLKFLRQASHANTFTALAILTVMRSDESTLVVNTVPCAERPRVGPNDP